MPNIFSLKTSPQRPFSCYDFAPTSLKRKIMFKSVTKPWMHIAYWCIEYSYVFALCPLFSQVIALARERTLLKGTRARALTVVLFVPYTVDLSFDLADIWRQFFSFLLLSLQVRHRLCHRNTFEVRRWWAGRFLSSNRTGTANCSVSMYRSTPASPPGDFCQTSHKDVCRELSQCKIFLIFHILGDF